MEKIRFFIKEVLSKLFEEQASFDLLRNKLLSFGGDKVRETYEEDLDKLLAKGEFFKKKVTKVKMQPSKCHANSACFWGNYTKEHGTSSLKIVTGWALYDGTWTQHSWLYEPSKDRIIETTLDWEAYFGFILDDNEAYEFYDLNW